MPTLNINEEQVFSLIEQLSPEQQEQIFQILLLQKQQKTWETLSQKGQIQIKKIAEEKNKNWEEMTEEEREDFINDLIHEDRQCHLLPIGNYQGVSIVNATDFLQIDFLSGDKEIN